MSITFSPLIPACDDRLELNMANVNAHALLAVLGLTPPDGEDIDLPGCLVSEYGGYGEIDPILLQGRILIAQALLDAGSTDAEGVPAFTEGNYTYCGRRPGYLADKLAILAGITAWAIEHQVKVRWC